MKRAVVNFASGKWYLRGQARQRASMKVAGGGAEYIGFTDYKNIGSPTHQQVPYAFKTHALMYCLNKGYDEVIYVDASIWAAKSWLPIWDKITTSGYYFEEAGHWAGTWTKDSVLIRMGVSRDQAMKIPMFSAGFTGLNLRNAKAVEFLKRWHSYACDGDSFEGTWGNENRQMSKDPRCKGHRHDMSVASILAWQMDMQLGRGGTYLAYIGPGYKTPLETACAYLRQA